MQTVVHKNIIDEKASELEKKDMVVCSYVFAGMGSYEEVMPSDEVESFKCWIDCNGSALFGGCREERLKI